MKLALPQILFFLLALSVTERATAQKKVGVLCITSANKIVMRSKCSSTETKLSLATLSARGADGDSGATGASGSSGRVVVSTLHEDQTVPSAQGATFTESCPTGKTTLSGGCYTTSRGVVMNQSYPFDGSPNSWKCTFVPRGLDPSVFGVDITSYAICVDQ
jgi:hypothetical protein